MGCQGRVGLRHVAVAVVCALFCQLDVVIAERPEEALPLVAERVVVVALAGGARAAEEEEQIGRAHV